ncbi:MAG: hypothetical protein HFH35_07430 [Eubacterium sp.]|nr:hypothetical protein [Eubacterium sp.]
MAKIDNAVRIVEFESENDLYSQMENDLNTYFDEEYSKCFKLKNFQLIDKNHAILYFEEDPNIIMSRFMYNGEVLDVEDIPGINFFSLQEISLIDSLGVITISDTEYDIEKIEYTVDIYGSRHADIYLS